MPAALTALVVLAVCTLVTTALVQRLLGQRPVLSYDAVAARVHATSWNELPVLVGGGAAVLAGCALLAAALLRGRPVVVALASAAGIDAGTPRHGLERSLRAAAESVDGVAAAGLRLGRRKVRVKVRTNRTNREGLAEAVRTAVQGRLERVGPAKVPEVRVRVRGGRR
ncbi:DUF6286 domain-containing protein [Amycolatopsis vancoresmycina]|uniref:DUF6286 domain-containing protein n=1 Tax=Amycolatopsis vancoresmycina DSM 44592 TaxID=1292037 RepID=R1FJN6_9PSEU|nr:DUF6286 domain-containing protein [Amycolatopsis vancoresmycina]EOD59782.1 hypothetical protein H480_41360 [Amycolatopsis vancoresmycina DSM 44592]